MSRVLLTGVRGKTGVPLAELLAARPGVEVLGGSSRPATVAIDGVRPTAFSWDHPADWPVATEGVDALYVVLPIRADAPGLVGALLELTPPAAHVVLLSERDADQAGPDGWSVRAEGAVRGSGHSWSILRPSWFMQVVTDARFYLDRVRGAGELPFPSGGARVAWIDARDIAAVAERALLDGEHEGRCSISPDRSRCPCRGRRSCSPAPSGAPWCTGTCRSPRPWPGPRASSGISPP